MNNTKEQQIYESVDWVIKRFGYFLRDLEGYQEYVLGLKNSIDLAWIEKKIKELEPLMERELTPGESASLEGNIVEMRRFAQKFLRYSETFADLQHVVSRFLYGPYETMLELVGADKKYEKILADFGALFEIMPPLEDDSCKYFEEFKHFNGLRKDLRYEIDRIQNKHSYLWLLKHLQKMMLDLQLDWFKAYHGLPKVKGMMEDLLKNIKEVSKEDFEKGQFERARDMLAHHSYPISDHPELIDLVVRHAAELYFFNEDSSKAKQEGDFLKNELPQMAELVTEERWKDVLEMYRESSSHFCQGMAEFKDFIIANPWCWDGLVAMIKAAGKTPTYYDSNSWDHSHLVFKDYLSSFERIDQKNWPAIVAVFLDLVNLKILICFNNFLDEFPKWIENEPVKLIQKGLANLSKQLEKGRMDKKTVFCEKRIPVILGLINKNILSWKFIGKKRSRDFYDSLFECKDLLIDGVLTLEELEKNAVSFSQAYLARDLFEFSIRKRKTTLADAIRFVNEIEKTGIMDHFPFYEVALFFKFIRNVINRIMFEKIDIVYSIDRSARVLTFLTYSVLRRMRKTDHLKFYFIHHERKQGITLYDENQKEEIKGKNILLIDEYIQKGGTIDETKTFLEEFVSPGGKIVVTVFSDHHKRGRYGAITEDLPSWYSKQNDYNTMYSGLVELSEGGVRASRNYRKKTKAVRDSLSKLATLIVRYDEL